MFNHHTGPKPTCKILRTGKKAKNKNKRDLKTLSKILLARSSIIKLFEFVFANASTLLLCPFITCYSASGASHLRCLKLLNLPLNLNVSIQRNKQKKTHFLRNARGITFFQGFCILNAILKKIPPEHPFCSQFWKE